MPSLEPIELGIGSEQLSDVADDNGRLVGEMGGGDGGANDATRSLVLQLWFVRRSVDDGDWKAPTPRAVDQTAAAVAQDILIILVVVFSHRMYCEKFCANCATSCLCL